MTVEFFVSVLRNKSNANISELKANATHVKRLNLWLFEGDWEMTLPKPKLIDCLGEIIVPCLGDLSEVQIENLVRLNVRGI